MNRVDFLRETEWSDSFNFGRLPDGTWELHNEDGDDGTLVASGPLDDCLAALRRVLAGNEDQPGREVIGPNGEPMTLTMEATQRLYGSADNE